MQIKRLTSVMATITPADSSTHRQDLMGDDNISLSFTLAYPVEFLPGDYAMWNGAKYILNKEPKVVKASEREYQYTLALDAEYFAMRKMMCLFGTPRVVAAVDVETPPFLADYSVTGDAEVFLNLMMRNVRRRDPDYTLTINETFINSAKMLTFDSEDCLSVLRKIADAYETEYYVSGKAITFGKSTATAICTMGYGRGNGFTEITRQAYDDTAVITRLWPFGGDKNIDRPKYLNYLNTILSTLEYTNLLESPKRLVVPPGRYIAIGDDNIEVGEDFSIERNVSLFGVSESSVKFDDIYPGYLPLTVSHVVAIDDAKALYDIRCSTLGFNVDDCLIAGVTPAVKFNTGNLAGYEFQFSYKDSDKRFELVPIEDNGWNMPKGTLIPAVGDTFIITGIMFPQSYIEAAEVMLLTNAANYLIEHSVPRVQYAGKVDKLHFKKYAPSITPSIGDTIHFTDAAMGIDTNLRISGLKRSIVNPYEYELTISNIVKTNQFAKLANDVKVVDTKFTEKGKTIEATYNRELKAYNYLKTALNEKTRISGGLILSSLISLGYTVSSVFEEKSGISGIDIDGEWSPYLWAGGSFEEAIEFINYKRGLTHTSYGSIKTVWTMGGKLYTDSAELEGEIRATSGRVAGLLIQTGGLTNEGLNSNSYIIQRYDDLGIFTGLGTNVLPSTAFAIALARLEIDQTGMNTDPFGDNVYSLILKAKTDAWLKAYALYYEGAIKGKGYISMQNDSYVGQAYTDTLELNANEVSSYIFDAVGSSLLTVNLPALSHLTGVTNCRLYIKLMNADGNSIRVTAPSGITIKDNNFATYGAYLDMSPGDAVEFQFLKDSGSTGVYLFVNHRI